MGKLVLKRIHLLLALLFPKGLQVTVDLTPSSPNP